jgi:uncharacterized protein (TIGR03067 family)
MTVKVRLLALTAAALLAFGAAAGDAAVKKELAKLQGAWQVVRGEENGEPVSEYVVQNLKWGVKGDRLTLQGVAPLTDRASQLAITLDASTTPKCIDLKVEAGSQKGTVFEGVYEWKGDELRLCLHLARGARPVEFETRSGPNRVLLVLKRETP